MTMLVSTMKNRIKTGFEGGSALPIDWNLMIEKGAESLLIEINPHNLKQRKPILGGLSTNRETYLCFDDVHYPTIIADAQGNMISKYLPPLQYKLNQGRDEVFTIENINGKRFLKTRTALGGFKQETSDDFSSLTARSGLSIMQLTDFGAIEGKYSLRAVFTATETSLVSNLSLDDTATLSNYLDGSCVMSAYLTDPKNVSAIKIRLKQDATNYYELDSADGTIINRLIEGHNDVVFDMSTLKTIGAPVLDNLVQYEIEFTPEDGASVVVVLDAVKFHKTGAYYLEYYSNYFVIDKDTLEPKKAPESDLDIINMGTDELAILEYEAKRQTLESNSFNNISDQTVQNIVNTLATKYEAYHMDNPSEQTPLQYEYDDDHTLLGDITGHSSSV